MKKLGVLLTLAFLAICAIYFVLHPSKDEFVEEDLYTEIINRGVLKVGINNSTKPFGFTDKNGKLTGYDVDLAKYIAQYIVKDPERLEIIPVTLSNRLMMASTGAVDMVISSITITPQREEIVSFSIPYDSAGQSILVKSNSRINSLTDLAGQNVGVVFGTTAEKNMRNLVPNANLLGYKTYEDAYQALKRNEINAITSDDTILSGFALDDKSVKLLPKRYSKEPYGVAFKKGNSTLKLKENVDFAIEDLQKKNVIPRLRKKWNIGI